MKFAVFCRNDYVSNEIKDYILKKLSFEYNEINPDVVITIGGDGTILRIVDKYIDRIDTIKFLGINSGHLGFYTNWMIEEVDQAIDSLIKGNYRTTDFKMLEYCINNKDIAYALNEVTIVNPPLVQVIDVYIDGYRFEVFRGSGLCISTPTGSTAYNKSLGGAIIDPELEAIQLTEIASINSNAFRTLGASIVVPKNKHLCLASSETSDCIITADFKQIRISNFKSLDIKLSDKIISFIVKEEKTFWHRVNSSFI